MKPPELSVELLDDVLLREMSEVVAECLRVWAPAVASEARGIVCLHPACLGTALGKFAGYATVGEKIEQSGLLISSVVVETEIDMSEDCGIGCREDTIEESIKVVFGVDWGACGCI